MTAPTTNRKWQRDTGGFTLLEAILACAVFSVAAIALAHSLQILGDIVTNVRREEEIVRTLRTMLEEQRFLRPLTQGEQVLESPFPEVTFRTVTSQFEAQNRDGQPLTGLYRVAVVARWKEGTQTRERTAEALCNEELPDY
ncbi:MAG: type II secretion system GspH family protein [Verrucomicrobia bacterium]|nr:type II secretion system GspH family protein [Verrucomicrobiota bacterium]